MLPLAGPWNSVHTTNGIGKEIAHNIAKITKTDKKRECHYPQQSRKIMSKIYRKKLFFWLFALLRKNRLSCYDFIHGLIVPLVCVYFGER